MMDVFTAKHTRSLAMDVNKSVLPKCLEILSVVDWDFWKEGSFHMVPSKGKWFARNGRVVIFSSIQSRVGRSG